MTTLAQFRERPSLRNAWIKESGLEVYLRKSHRTEHGLLTDPRGPQRYRSQGSALATLEIANVSAKRPGQGCFTTFRCIVEQLYSRIYVENVLETRFCEYFQRNGYQICTPEGQYPPCLIWTRKDVV